MIGVKNEAAEILARITQDPDGCWRMPGWKSGGGYTYVRYEGRDWRAHRLVYTLLIGPIPVGLTLDHLCRQKECVNPSHCDPCTDVENVRRYLATITHCPQGHPLSGANLKVTKTRPTVRRCRRCFNDNRNAARAAGSRR